MHWPFRLERGYVREVRRYHQHPLAGVFQQSVQLRQAVRVYDQGATFGPLEHHLRPSLREGSIQGNIAVASKKTSQHAGERGGAPIRENRSELRRRKLRMSLDGCRNSARRIAQFRVTHALFFCGSGWPVWKFF